MATRRDPPPHRGAPNAARRRLPVAQSATGKSVSILAVSNRTLRECPVTVDSRGSVGVGGRSAKVFGSQVGPGEIGESLHARDQDANIDRAGHDGRHGGFEHGRDPGHVSQHGRQQTACVFREAVEAPALMITTWRRLRRGAVVSQRWRSGRRPLLDA